MPLRRIIFGWSLLAGRQGNGFQGAEGEARRGREDEHGAAWGSMADRWGMAPARAESDYNDRGFEFDWGIRHNRSTALRYQLTQPRRRQPVSRRSIVGLRPLRRRVSGRATMDPTEHRLCADGSWVRRIADPTTRW